MQSWTFTEDQGNGCCWRQLASGSLLNVAILKISHTFVRGPFFGKIRVNNWLSYLVSLIDNNHLTDCTSAVKLFFWNIVLTNWNVEAEKVFRVHWCNFVESVSANISYPRSQLFCKRYYYKPLPPAKKESRQYNLVPFNFCKPQYA